MPLRFSFDASFLTTATTLERGLMSTRLLPRVGYPSYASAVAPNQSIVTSGGVDVFAMTLVQGETYKFDIDNGSINLELDIINHAGKRVGGNDDFNGGRDPFLSFTADQTGTYYVAVRHASNDYIDGSFDWERTPAPTRDLQLLGLGGDHAEIHLQPFGCIAVAQLLERLGHRARERRQRPDPAQRRQ
jgi:hypothetical protein